MLTMKALSIRQPWAWLICHGGKDVENRTWQTYYRGWVLIHAGKVMSRAEYDEAMDWVVTNKGIPLGFPPPSSKVFGRGGIVGVMRIVGCVQRSRSPWFVGPWGFEIADARPLPFWPCRGALGFFDVDYEVDP